VIQFHTPGYGPIRTVNKRLAKNLEKLSSGRRINRAGDDPAGLTMSEKMQAEITGLGQAQRNVRDAISLIQTAEGALEEIHEMLNRMTELSDQSANGTYDDALDRVSLQREVVQLKEEINRIANSTNFNGIFPLKGEEKDPAAEETKPDLDTLKAETEREFYQVLESTSGVTEKTAGYAKWTGTLSGIQAGTTLTISLGETTKTFEFAHYESDALKNRGNVWIDVNSANLESSLKTQVASELGITVNFTKSTGVLELTSNNADSNEKFTLTVGDAISSTGSEKDFGKSVTSKADGREFRISGISNMEAFRDGAIIEISGTQYELDFDGTSDPSHQKLSFTSPSSEVDLMTQIKEQIAKKLPGKTVRFLVQGDGTRDLIVRFPKDTQATGDVVRLVGAGSPTPEPKDVSSQAGQTEVTAANAKDAVTKAAMDFSKLEAGDTIQICGTTYTFVKETPTDTTQIEIAEGDDALAVAQKLAAAVNGSASASPGGNSFTVIESESDSKGKVVFQMTAKQDGAIQIEYKSSYLDRTLAALEPSELESEEDKNCIRFQIGTSSKETLALKLRSMTTSALRIETISVANQDSAAQAVDLLRDAINEVSDYRGDFGANQNRLEHTLYGLSITEENTTASESVIADTNIAEEMTAFVKNQIISQSAQSVWAQSMNLARDHVQRLINP